MNHFRRAIVTDDVRVFVGEAPQSDDLAILVVRYEG